MKAFDFKAIFGNVGSKWYLYLIVVLLIAGAIVFFSLKKPAKRNNLNKTQTLAFTAVLTALCTVLNIFTIPLQNTVAISFVATICFMAGYLLGAKCGFAVGFIGDLIGAIIHPFGAYNPLIGLATGLLGFIPGIIFSYFKGNKYLLTAISSLLCLVLCTSGLNTFALWLMYAIGKKSFFTYLGVRLPWQAIVWAINLVLCLGLVSVLNRVLPKNKFYLENAVEDNKTAEETA